VSYPRFDIGLLDHEAARLQATVERLDDRALADPSGCGGWTRGHVVSHLARHAEALAGVLAAVEDLPPQAFVPGEVTAGLRPVYRDEAERDRGIDAHTHDPAEQLSAALAAATVELHRRLRNLPAHLTEARVERTPGATSVPLGQLPFQRLREVVVHHVDLLCGFTFDDVDDETGRLLLADTLQRVVAVAPVLAPRLVRDEAACTVEIGGVVVSGLRPKLLSWLLRQQGHGLRVDGRDLPVVPAV
jgi:maleylpyruvate isomerase